MPALTHPKREAFAQFLLRNLIAGTMSRGKAAEAAAREAGYRGSALADNARKWANQADVKARMAEIAQPIKVETDPQLAMDVEGAKLRLAEIIRADSGLAKVKPADVIAAVRQLSTMEGWDAPTKHEHTGKDGAPLIDATKLSDEQLVVLESILLAAGSVAVAPDDPGGTSVPEFEGKPH